MHRKRRAIRVATLLASAVIPALGLSQTSAPDTVQTIATGLDNPRGLSFDPEGSLYVAEAGKGGAGPCGPGPLGTRCYGTSGAITRIDLKKQEQARVAAGLPSLASPIGRFAA